MTSSAREVVARLIAREPTASSAQNSAVTAASALKRLSSDLSRFIGTDGCYALLTRARSQAEAAHPSLKNIRIIARPELSVHGVPESIEASGTEQTAAALESTLVALIDLLGRLIGEELAMKLVEQSGMNGASPDRLNGRPHDE